jgi:hypothetical protein
MILARRFVLRNRRPRKTESGILNDMSAHAEDETRRIRRWIRRCESRLVERFPVLAHQDAIGATLTALCASGMIGLAWLYATGRIPALVCVLGNAFLASILHEIEHDLIHFLYFKQRPAAHNTMMFVVWAFRGNVPHGWYRRGIHVHHHRASGTATDVEERLLGLGMPWGLRRLLVSVDGLMAFVLNARRLEKEIPGFRRLDLAMAALPFYAVFVTAFAAFCLYHGMLALGVAPPAVMDTMYPALSVVVVAWVLPNYLRQAALQVVSSNVHYYGDVHSVREETQMLRPTYLLPLQLFCFNFGATHCFHHFVVEQPFYVRQMIASSVRPYLRGCGVRENDTRTFARANRFDFAR